VTEPFFSPREPERGPTPADELAEALRYRSTLDPDATDPGATDPEPADPEARRRADPRWQIAERVAAAVLRRWPAEVRAIGVHGSLAHGDDRETSDVDIVVVTYRPGTGPTPDSRRIDGVLVDLGVIGADEYLSHARTLSTSWPLVADQYLTTAPLHDDSGWHAELRDTHLGRLAEATGREFATLARSSWCASAALLERSVRLGEWYDTDGALLALVEARRAAAVTEGLLDRTYFRSSMDAVRRAELAGADRATVRDRLAAQATELERRGRPVDGSVDDLLG
jgi:hypothetical protein